MHQNEQSSEIRFKNKQGSVSYVDILNLLPGLLLILLGVLFLLSYYGIVKGEWWQYFLVGLGVVLLVSGWIQRFSPIKEWPKIDQISSGLLLISIGVLFLFGFNPWWPLLIICIGIILVVRYMLVRRHQQDN